MKSVRTLSVVALIATGVVSSVWPEKANGQGMMEYASLAGSMPKPDPKHAAGAANQLFQAGDVSRYAGRAKSRADAAAASSGARGGGAGASYVRNDGIVAHPSGTPKPIVRNANKNAKGKTTPLGPTVSREVMIKESARASELYKKATTSLDAGKLDEALAAYKGSLNIREAYWHGQDAAVPGILTAMSKIYLQQDKADDAIATAERSLGALGLLYGPGSEHRVKPLSILGAAYLKKGNKSKAEDSYQQALALSAKSKGSADSIKVALEIGQATRQADILPLAAEAYKVAVASEHDAETALGAPKLTEALGEYKEVLQKLERTKEANAVQASLERIQSGVKAPEKAAESAADSK